MDGRVENHPSAAAQDWGLFIGGICEAKNIKSLSALGISAVVNAAPDVVHAARLQAGCFQVVEVCFRVASMR